MDKNKFREGLGAPVLKTVFDFCETQDGWFQYQEAFDYTTKTEKARRKEAGHISMGKPSKTHSSIRFLIKIGYLEADPSNGLKVNKDFVPLDQQ